MMLCPDCSRDSTVVKTAKRGAEKVRFRACVCGARWVTAELAVLKDGAIERWGCRQPHQVTGNLGEGYRQPSEASEVTGNLDQAGERLRATGKGYGQPEKVAGNLPGERGGKGGGVSGDRHLDLSSGSGSDSDPLSRSGSDLDRDLDPPAALVLTCQEEASPKRKRPGGTQLAFSPEFLAFWEVYPRKVAKPLAWRSWLHEKPVLDEVLAALAWQRESGPWQEFDKIPHPSSYLRGRRWEDERPPPSAARVAARPSANANPRVGWGRPSDAKHKGTGIDHDF